MCGQPYNLYLVFRYLNLGYSFLWLDLSNTNRARARHERSALLSDQSEENHKPHFAPADVHSDMRVMGLRLGHYHA